jgi:hypothetical protein
MPNAACRSVPPAAEIGSQQTRRWRKLDSNHPFLITRCGSCHGDFADSCRQAASTARSRAHHSRRKAAQAGLMPHLGSRSECESDQPSAMAMCAVTSSCNVAMEVGSAGAGECGSKPEVSLPPPPSGMLRFSRSCNTHLGAGAAMVQPFFSCAWNHSTEPGWGTD